MRVLIVIEKPFYLGVVENALLRNNPWPDATIDYADVLSRGWWRFDWPKSYRISSLPRILEPCFRLNETEGMRPRIHVRDTETGNMSRRYPFQGDDAAAMARAFPSRYDVIVNMLLPGHRGASIFYRLISGGASAPERAVVPHADIYQSRLGSIDDASLDLALSKLASGSAARWTMQDEDLAYGLAKDRLDYNWMANATGLLARPLSEAGAVPRAESVELKSPVDRFGRNALMLTMLLARNVDRVVHREDLLRTMRNWSGTGKYEFYRSRISGVRFGAEASREAIINNLLDIDILRAEEVSERHSRKMMITDACRRFANTMPKEAFDPDLPFRISQWCGQGSAAYGRMDAYILRLFKAVKRRTSSNGNADAANASGCWFGERRRALGWTVADAARKAQIPLRMVELIEADEMTSGPTRSALASALGAGTVTERS